MPLLVTDHVRQLIKNTGKSGRTFFTRS